MDCMKDEMRVWDRERMTRRFVRGWVMLLAGLMVMGTVHNAWVSWGVGSAFTLGGVVAIFRTL